MSQSSHLHSVDPQDGGGSQGPSRTPQRQRAARPLPTDRIKMDVQPKVLETIGRLSGAGKQPVNANELSKRVGLVPATVILSNRFFADAGWIENQRGLYTAKDALVEYVRRCAVSGEATDDALEALRVPVREQSWFWEALSPYLAEGGSLPLSEATIVLMRAAGANDNHMPMITNLIAWLEIIGLIAVEDGQVRLASGAAPNGSAEMRQQPAEQQPASAPDAATGGTGEKPTGQPGAGPPYVIAFNFEVRMTAEDLARLSGEQIKSFFESVGTVMALGKG